MTIDYCSRGIRGFGCSKAAKIYDEAPDADPVEKQEEMDRMRLHVMKEFDKNDDRMVSLEEFQRGINGKDARNDQGWKV